MEKKNKFHNTIKVIRLSEIKPETLKLIFQKKASELVIYHKIENLINIYPNIEKWYKEKVLKELKALKPTREVLVALDIEKINVVGMAILKKTEEENKICTIRVDREYLHQGVGTKLFEEAFLYLEDTKPLITISEDNIECFKYILKKFDFEKIEEIKGLYVPEKIEYIYNKKWKED